MKKVKRRLAVIMAVLLMFPAQSTMATAQPLAQTLKADIVAGGEKKESKATPGNAAKREIDAENEGNSGIVKTIRKKSMASATPTEARKEAEATDEVKFNTGKHIYSVVSKEDFFDLELGDAYFEEDGSYTINIPEENPFFPYEVEFTYCGKKERKWFMTPKGSVEVGEHTFYVSAYFDKSMVTQMNLSIGSNTVIVYPKEKEFTDEETNGVEPASMLPLQSRDLTVDLSGYTPVELTMVSVNEIFMGQELTDSDKVIWNRYGRDDYTISMSGDKLDLSYDTCDNSNVVWEMIVGDDNQLAVDNIIYYVDVQVTPSANWLIPVTYTDAGGWKKEENLYTKYYDYDDERCIEIMLPSLDHRAYNPDGSIWGLPRAEAWVSLEFNKSVFPETKFDYVKIYEGQFTSVPEAMASYEIGHELLQTDRTQVKSGYFVWVGQDRDWGEKSWMTMVTFDAEGNATGCLPFIFSLDEARNEVLYDSDLQMEDEGEYINVNGYTDIGYKHDEAPFYLIRTITHYLYKGYTANHKYYHKMSYQKGTEGADVIAAYVGKYASMEDAEKAGAKDIKDELFNSKNGYGADYSTGIFFTVFSSLVGIDGTIVDNKYSVDYYFIKAIEGEIPRPFSSNANVYFSGLSDSEGNNIDAYIVNENEDSYAEKSYFTMLVDEDVDLTSLAPLFHVSDKVKLYAEGSSTPEVSGKSLHDFSKGPVQYTVSDQNGIESRNIWLQIVKAGVGNGTLYINSLGDEKANTKVENEIIYSTREMFLDGRYDYLHDIVLINLGSEAIPAISVELVSDEVELDKYWMLNGEYSLPDISNGGKSEHEQWNLAKLRICPKDGMADGRDITGTLIIKSGEKVLMVLTLTGTVGDPGVMTQKIPQAVKYVPYGTMIQNNNKYSWNQVSYKWVDGKLPKGMEIKPNGELYGVPTEMGDFMFTVRMENTYPSFAPSEKTFTLKVIENTDENVDGATDEGYILTQRVQDMLLDAVYDQTMISQGIYDEFTDVFLDGVKLTKDADYTSESGSTRITIRKETLKANNVAGRHTLGIEFRTGETKILKRAAQNYEIKIRNQDNNSNNDSNNNNSNNSGNNSSSSGSSSGGGRSRSSSKNNASSVLYDAKKGYYDSRTGIITGEGERYSHWIKDENGWRLNYADGTFASGYITQLADGTALEQVSWEQINGAWYAFGITGYLKSGWVCDYQLNGWYYMTEYGMYSGWYGDAQDNCVYYMEPGSGKLAAGWKNIDGKWYYFNETTTIPTWNFNAITGEWVYNPIAGYKPYGAAYINERTPDGYFVGVDGVWDGQEKE